MKNGKMWKDTDGNDIQCHGGCILEHSGVYYWYGEHKGIDNDPGKARVDAIGVSCYSSKDLKNWKYEGLVLSADESNEWLSPKGVIERPKVVYNEKTGKFVMWMHVAKADYSGSRAGIAVSSSPTGQFEFLCAKLPNVQDCADLTLFVDDDKTAYLVHAANHAKTLNVARLTDDYTDVDGLYYPTFCDQSREAPCVCKNDGMYFMITSGTSGWEPNPALYATWRRMLGQWCLRDNPCEGENYHMTFNGQGAFILETKGKYYFLLDHWVPENLKMSGYSLLPIEFYQRSPYENGRFMRIKWQEDWLGI